MSKYDDLFDETRAATSVFADKRALDPLAAAQEIVARDAQERRLATILNGVHDGYLPTTVAVHGPPGTGKTLTTRRVCEEFAARCDDLAVEYVNLKECRTVFSAANEILVELTGERKGAYEGLDGVFDGIWAALEAYPPWTVLLLDEIDHVGYDSNYDPNEFFYRLFRGEKRLEREIGLSVWLLSNQLLEVDLRVDSRVGSAMSGEEVFFGPYDAAELEAILRPRLRRAFGEGAIAETAIELGVREAANRWGDARKALTLFRHAGETANDRGLDVVTPECVTANLEATEKEAVLEKLEAIPLNHMYALTAMVVRRDGRGSIVQPVTTAVLHEILAREGVSLSKRAVRDVVRELETMGLVETWIDSRGRDGRVKQVKTTFDPEWVRIAQADRAVERKRRAPS
ncbi:Cdc6/Cdc18 family protein [Halorarius litoreus]|uniref:Cdc6/Cdc18 family protein n=1 Tax=Halorarius litoreus TaxID=2962676 RepID=UPI0020CF5872|nr:AAA family ATPase [Halorarius litoreus]